MQLNKTLQTFESSMNRKLNRVAADGEDLGKKFNNMLKVAHLVSGRAELYT